ncbi:ABC transporter permease [Cohnella faecalis]|uniref:ABC transporter permease subunit n=1 Tax=Cohnella faecalis TaxID=2315694 RepID=A0A398CHV4_9BACL|nr:ABC transporter permease subunit [Cohnella faecalis]RIE01915.1 ABC transporter permease subunit [Cohnella faecalis]
MEIAENIRYGEARIRRKASVSLSAAVRLLLPSLSLIAVLAIHYLLPDKQPVLKSDIYAYAIEILLAVYLLWTGASFVFEGARAKLRYQAPITAFIILLIGAWELLTLKLDALPLPYFPSPVKITDALVNDREKLFICTLYSLRLLAIGYLIGAFFGVITGILMGWYKLFQYWVNPFLRFIGPVPATAWIPVVLLVFPSSFTASIFLIALGTWFPVSVMTWSGISSVNKSFFEVAKTLGATERYLVLRVALPAAFPLIFIGLFMGLGTSFVTLVVAEMLGVKAGLGFYITWAQGWAEYYKVYAALLIMAVLFSTIITVLFKVRDRVLIWQKGLIKW